MYFYYSIEPEPVPMSVTVNTNMFHTPEVSHVIIESKIREIAELRQQIEYARKTTTVLMKIYFPCTLD